MIKNDVGGELFLIETADTYPVSYDETIDVGQKEHSDNARPCTDRPDRKYGRLSHNLSWIS